MKGILLMITLYLFSIVLISKNILWYLSYIYPGDYLAKSAIANEIHVNHHHTDEEYNSIVKNSLRESIKNFNPDFILYNAGTDCMEGDPLGSKLDF
jgi:histone deacetylase 11